MSSPHLRVVQDGRVLVVFRQFKDDPKGTCARAVLAGLGIALTIGPYEIQQLSLDGNSPRWETLMRNTRAI